MSRTVTGQENDRRRQRYPDFPDKQLLKSELELAQKPLFKIRENGKWGCMDSTLSVKTSPKLQNLCPTVRNCAHA